MENLVTYAIIDHTGVCVNKIIWNESDEWTPPENCIALPDSGYEIGDQTKIVFPKNSV